MAWWVGPAVAAASSAFRGGRNRNDYQRAIANLRSSRPTGYLLPEDYATSDRQLGRQVERIGTAERQRVGEATTRNAQLGISGPAAQRAIARIRMGGLTSRYEAGRDAEDYLSNLKLSREGYERQKDLAIFGASTREADNNARRRDLADATWANSVLEFLPQILSGYGDVPGAEITASRDSWDNYLPNVETSAYNG